MVVSPSEVESEDGSFATPASCCPGYLRYQQVFPAEDFVNELPGGRGLLSGFAWRPDSFDLFEPLTVDPHWLQLRVSTTQKAPGELSLSFRENVGEDETLVFDKTLELQTAFLGPPGGPKEFDYIFPFENDFYYDATQGNLLVDYIYPNGLDRNPIGDVHSSPGPVALFTQTPGDDVGSTVNRSIVHQFTFNSVTVLHPGDADQDLDFDQLDLVRVQAAGKYLTGRMATWGEGDWDGAPGGEPGNPPPGNGLFDQIDFVAALHGADYLQGPYAALKLRGMEGDGQTSLVYHPETGELKLDAPAGIDLTSVNVTSASSLFIGSKPHLLDGAFDNFEPSNLFKATFGGSFGSLSFGRVLPIGLGEAEVASDLSAVGSLDGGGDIGAVDLIFIPEPITYLLLWTGLTTCLIGGQASRQSIRRTCE